MNIPVPFDPKVKLTDHFSIKEATRSVTAMRFVIDNTPSEAQLNNMRYAAQQLEKVRVVLGGNSIHVDSWFRCKELNKKVGGVPNSGHLDGYCIDFICPDFGTPEDIIKAIIKAGIKFDQCIQEGDWVHISFAPAMRQIALNANFERNPDGSVKRVEYTKRKDNGTVADTTPLAST